jgi:D-alanine-D-alanine ligase
MGPDTDPATHARTHALLSAGRGGKPSQMARRGERVLLLAGGISGEHSISLRSAATVLDAVEQAGYDTITVGITLEGRWLLGDLRPLLTRAKSELISLPPDFGLQVTAVNDGSGLRLLGVDGVAIDARHQRPDVVFPVLHWPGGEDGRLQGFLDSVGAAYVGAGCTASALAMDKLAMKYACAGAAIPQVEFLGAGSMSATDLIRSIEQAFGFPCFVKPANLGSSVGISRVSNPSRLPTALAEARRWDRRVVVERAADVREIEVALLGNDNPEISPLGEIVTKKGFYDFESKYVTDSAVELIAPADVDRATSERIADIAKQVWALIGCRGMARADFFVERSTGAVLFNEINTIPGMTRISMYPRLWAAAGLEPGALFDRLIRLALEEHAWSTTSRPASAS